MNNDYWKSYYKDRKRQPPSSFYHFIKDKITKDDVVLDVGAGDGRDTFPLSKRCKEIYVLEPNNNLPWPNFENISFVEKPVDIVYARFFFHAVIEKVENDVLYFCESNQSTLFAEFRTEPIHGDHKRRVVNPSIFIDKLIERGYRNIELYLGQFSPHGDDNPLLARVIAKYD